MSREMMGVSDLTGQTLNGLQVQAMVSRRPEPRYQTRCVQCGTMQTESQRDLSQGRSRCRNSGCARVADAEEANLTLAQFQRREEQRFQRKVDTAKEQFEANEKRIADTTRRMISEGRDADVWIDPATAYVTMGAYEAEVFNDREAARFIAETPAFMPCPENLETIGAYLGRNGMSAIVSAETLKAAFERLDRYGLLKRRADVQPEPKQLDYASRPNVEVRIAPAKPAKPEPIMGFDLRTGERREFTQREVNLMSADEYRRTFRVYKSDLQLPNIGPGGHAQR